MFKLKGIREIIFTIALAVIIGAEGCTSPLTIGEAFSRTSRDLTPPERQALLETIQILRLLEDYRSALGKKDIEEFGRCFSPQFSYYEKDLGWLKKRTEEDFFNPFSSLRVSLREIEIGMTQKYSSHWMRQEAFDWLNSSRAQTAFSQPYLITLHSDSGPVDILFETGSRATFSSPRRPSGQGENLISGYSRKAIYPHESGLEPEEERGKERVTVRFLTDYGVGESLGEVSFYLFLQAWSPASGDSCASAYTLQEKVIFLLEKEEGEWKIISRQ